MCVAAMKAAITEFEVAIAPPPHDGRAESDETQQLARLLAALDGLAVAYHATKTTRADADHPHAPRSNYKQLRSELGATFPSFGLYAVVTPLPDPDTEILMGDAIDDLSDIAGELREVGWRLRNTTAEDAAWTFRFGFEHHWGRHLADVRSYLHFVLFGC